MSLFKKLESNEIIEQETDTLGGSKFSAWESGVYPVTIALAYADESAGGAMNVNFTFVTEDGKELKITEYVTSGKDKGQTNYYTNKDGTKKYLPGFVTVNDICLLTVGESLSDMETDAKVLSLYNYDQKKEVPTKKEVLTDLLGKEVTLGILKVIKDKYNKPGETQTINEISKVFSTANNMTCSEIRAEETEASFIDAWAEKHTGKTINKVGKDNAKATAAFESPKVDKPKKSLFK